MTIDETREVLLFHGTKPENIDSITTNGFSLQSANYGLYGAKLYFTDSCQKLDQYADRKYARANDETELTMILARVSLGNSALYSDYDERWHNSCIGGKANTNHMRFYEFMICNEEQCFPEYVIYYKRV